KRKTTKLGFPGFDLRMQMPFGERNPAISLLAFLVLFPVILFQLFYLVQTYKIQVINIHYPAEYLFYLAICSRMLRIKMVISVHGADIFPEGRPLPRYSPAFKFLLSSSDVIIAPSKRFMKDFLTVFPGLREKTTFIYNSVDISGLTLSSQGAVADD